MQPRTSHLISTLVAAAVMLLAVNISAQVQLPDPDGKGANMRKRVKVFILMGQSNMLGFGKVGPESKAGSLQHAVQVEQLYPFLVDDAGAWTERKDVRNVRVMVARGGGMRVFNNEWMTIKGGRIGPEIGIGHHLGNLLDEPVLILKSCIGNRSLGWDLLPPGSKRFEHGGKVYAGYKDSPDAWEKGTKPEPIGWYAGKQYDDDTANAKKVLAELRKYYPGARGFEIAGFFWWQGAKDCGNAAHSERYEQNFVRLIEQLRKDFKAPKAKFVCATLGHVKKSSGGNNGKVLKAQLAVDGRKGKYKQFKGNVASVYANPFCHGGSANGHYGGNAKTYMDVGLAMGEAMVELLKKGKPEPSRSTKSTRQAKTAKKTENARKATNAKTAKKAETAKKAAPPKRRAAPPRVQPKIPDELALEHKIHPEELALKPQIDAAIAAGIEHILNNQRRDGSWSGPNYPGGRTGLCAYALLRSGVPTEHPGLRRAFAFLDSVEPDKTYAIACMMLAYEALGDERYRPRLRRLLARLLDGQARDGSWAYPHGAADLSNTQYAALGLWAAHKAGIAVPTEVWTNLIRGTLLYQEDLHDVDVDVVATGRTGLSKLRVAGFEYRRSQKSGQRKATGTMTTAGVSILKICEIGLGKRLRKNERRRLNEAMDAGWNWLHAHFSVKHPQLPRKGGKWLHYYLYGMERVGSLVRKERFGKHWWYLEGARALLKQQKNGAWGTALHDTCFALLFLRRATKLGAITGGAGGRSGHLFAAGGKNDDVAFRGAGQTPVLLYIEGFGKPLLAEHSRYGLRILRVEYVEDGRKLGQLAGDPRKAWKNDTFLYRCPHLSHGTHTVVARVIALAPDSPDSDTPKTVTIESTPMKVTIRDVIEPWMESITEMRRDDVLRAAKPKLTVSSNPKHAKHLIDGLDATHWLSDPVDATPTIEFETDKPIIARRLLLTQALTTRADLAKIGLIRTVELAWDRSKKVERFEMHNNPLAPTVFEFKRPRRIGKFTLRIVERTGKPGLPVGFAEVALAAKRVNKARSR